MASRLSTIDHDPFAHTRMPLGGHLEELRSHLWRAVAGLAVAVILSFFVSDTVLRFIAAPIAEELREFHRRRARKAAERLEAGDPVLVAVNRPTPVPITIKPGALAQALGIEAVQSDEPVTLIVLIEPVRWRLALIEADWHVVRPPNPTTMSVAEAFVVYFKVSLYCGLVLAGPWILYQLWSFVAAGLYPHEKGWLKVYLPVSLFLFLAGVALCELVVIPRAVEYLLSFNEWIGLEPELRLSEWLGFALITPLIFGSAFQTPLVMFFLCRIGVMDADFFRKQRKLAILLMTILAALGPAQDAVSLLALAVPMCVLYELGIVCCRLWAPRMEDGDDVEAEMIEA